jgi:hypothetical protein
MFQFHTQSPYGSQQLLHHVYARRREPDSQIFMNLCKTMIFGMLLFEESADVACMHRTTTAMSQPISYRIVADLPPWWNFRSSSF